MTPCWHCQRWLQDHNVRVGWEDNLLLLHDVRWLNRESHHEEPQIHPMAIRSVFPKSNVLPLLRQTLGKNRAMLLTKTEFVTMKSHFSNYIAVFNSPTTYIFAMNLQACKKPLHRIGIHHDKASEKIAWKPCCHTDRCLKRKICATVYSRSSSCHMQDTRTVCQSVANMSHVVGDQTTMRVLHPMPKNLPSRRHREARKGYCVFLHHRTWTRIYVFWYHYYHK